MTRAEAAILATEFDDGDAGIGVVRWRRKHTPRFAVITLYTDGRAPVVHGTSNVDWETAFAFARGEIA